MIKKSILLSIAVLTIIVGCSKEEENNTVSGETATVANDIFVEGKGVRKIWAAKAERDGLGNFRLAHLTFAPNNVLHTIFEYGGNLNNGKVNYTFYRKKINIITGDTIATTGIPNTNIYNSIAEDNGNRVLIPFTDKLTYIGGNAANQTIEGEASWLPVGGFQGGNFKGYSNFCKAKVYENQQIAATGVYIHRAQDVPYIWGRIFTGGKFTSAEKSFGDNALAASIELSTTGTALTFVAQKTDKLEVYDFVTEKLLVSLELPLFKQYIPSNYPASHIPTAQMITKRSQDGTKIIGLVRHIGVPKANTTQGVYMACSTFVYTIASNTLEIKVKNAIIERQYDTADCTDFDTQGNLYYLETPYGKQAHIQKITPSGSAVYRADFYKNSGIICVKSVMDKLFVVLQKGNQIPRSDPNDPKRGSILIAVCE
jgi:hypothetical protein